MTLVMPQETDPSWADDRLRRAGSVSGGPLRRYADHRPVAVVVSRSPPHQQAGDLARFVSPSLCLPAVIVYSTARQVRVSITPGVARIVW
jgi:hypothetical protein